MLQVFHGIAGKTTSSSSGAASLKTTPTTTALSKIDGIDANELMMNENGIDVVQTLQNDDNIIDGDGCDDEQNVTEILIFMVVAGYLRFIYFFSFFLAYWSLSDFFFFFI